MDQTLRSDQVADAGGVSQLASPDHSSCFSRRSWWTRISQQAVLGRLSSLQNGQIYIDDECRRMVAGHSGNDGLSATINVNDPVFYHQVAMHGALGAAESYLNGDWDCDNLPVLIRILARNLNIAGKRAGSWLSAAARLQHVWRKNTRGGSRRNIAAHYDLGNRFFELFLDPTMMYSAAMFNSPDDSLETAQNTRMERVCQRLQLKQQDHIVEIGTGWGGFACYAAENYGCRVTTTTISNEQYEYAKRRVAEADLTDRVEVLRLDYRDLSGQFDKLVSLEMIEAVGREFHDAYFQKCSALLRTGGRMVIQAIVMPDQRYDAYVKSVDFIQKYIFPGGSLPSVGSMQKSAATTEKLRMVDLEDFGGSYAQTLRVWKQRFHENIDQVRSLGYSDRFIRMWHYYFAYCEAAFDERSVGVVHAVWET